jgi:hypothetical protein
LSQDRKHGEKEHNPMRTEEIIIRLFCMVDDKLAHVNKRSNANLYPSEIVTIGILFTLKGVHYRAFYRWLKGDWLHLFPQLPECSRLLRLLAEYEPLTDHFLVAPQAESVIDSYGIELIHPLRQGRSPAQIGQKGISNHRWIVGVKLCWLITPQGQIIDWKWATANTHDQHLREVGTAWTDRTEVLSDLGFRKRGEEPINWHFCQHGERNDRMVVERVFSVITVVNHLKKIFHRVEKYLTARFGYTAAMLNCLIELADGKLALAQFSL